MKSLKLLLDIQVCVWNGAVMQFVSNQSDKKIRKLKRKSTAASEREATVASCSGSR